MSVNEYGYFETESTLDLLQQQLVEVLNYSPEDFALFGHSVVLIQFKIALLTPDDPQSKIRIQNFEATYPGAIAHNCRSMNIPIPVFQKKKKPVAVTSSGSLISEDEIDAILARVGKPEPAVKEPSVVKSSFKLEVQDDKPLPSESFSEAPEHPRYKDPRLLDDIIDAAIQDIYAEASVARPLGKHLINEEKLIPHLPDIEVKPTQAREITLQDLSPVNKAEVRQEAVKLLDTLRTSDAVKTLRRHEHIGHAIIQAKMWPLLAKRMLAESKLIDDEFRVWLEAYKIAYGADKRNTPVLNVITRNLVFIVQQRAGRIGHPDYGPGCCSWDAFKPSY